jgi:hypothetical protein
VCVYTLRQKRKDGVHGTRILKVVTLAVTFLKKSRAENNNVNKMVEERQLRRSWYYKGTRLRPRRRWKEKRNEALISL